MLTHAGELSGVKLHAVLGNLPLRHQRKIIPETVAPQCDRSGWRRSGLATAGWRFMAALAQAFGDDVLAPSASASALLVLNGEANAAGAAG